MDKQSIILERVITEYIDRREPISSKYLQNRLGIKISSATIRYYFKKLTQKGYLQKEHLSSGRIPSPISLKEFWRKKLKEKSYIIKKMEQLEKGAREEPIFCEYTLFDESTLVGLENYKDRFLVAYFESGEFVVPYNTKVHKIFEGLVGKTGLEISEVCKDIGLVGLGVRLKEFLEREFKVFNLCELVELARQNEEWAKEDLQKVCSGEELYRQKAGLRFLGNFLNYKFYLDINHKTKAEVLLMGHLDRNYLKVIQNLKKE